MRQLYVILKFYIKANTARLVLLHALKNFTKIADIITFLIQRYLLLRRTFKTHDSNIDSNNVDDNNRRNKIFSDMPNCKFKLKPQ